ncbi:hypothetical protein OpiT1DRAFT_02400 [Opitutaceae bacterium TAV1]|nr:hypothetical protein OpiT1DRAFT_02400 [Opitutaceae bacterium TAV1]
MTGLAGEVGAEPGGWHGAKRGLGNAEILMRRIVSHTSLWEGIPDPSCRISYSRDSSWRKRRKDSLTDNT